QCALGSPALGDVAGDLGKAEKRTVVVVNGVDDDVSKEFRSVLADAPALSFIAALPCRCFKRALRQAGVAVLLGIKGREMLADDLFRRVPLDPLGARIPARDLAFGTELEDRVIGDALYKQAELFLAGA